MDLLKDIYPSLLEIVKTLVGALVIFLLGWEAYRRQKIHEEIREYYFKNGIEIISTEIRERHPYIVSLKTHYGGFWLSPGRNFLLEKMNYPAASCEVSRNKEVIPRCEHRGIP